MSDGLSIQRAWSCYINLFPLPYENRYVNTLDTKTKNYAPCPKTATLLFYLHHPDTSLLWKQPTESRFQGVAPERAFAFVATT